MQKAFFELVEERHHSGKTIVLSSHILPEIQQHCSRAAILREGRLIACDSVDRLAGRQYKKIEIKGISEVPSIPGVRETRRENGKISFLFCGNMKELLAVLSVLPIEDIMITEPELEEIFLHYYEKGEAEK